LIKIYYEFFSLYNFAKRRQIEIKRISCIFNPVDSFLIKYYSIGKYGKGRIHHGEDRNFKRWHKGNHLTVEDLDRLMSFYRSLPEEDLKYLRVDVTNKNIVKQRIEVAESANIFRIIALQGDSIVADGALELTTEEWRRHQGELRVIVAKEFRRKGVGMIIMREVYFLAMEKKVEKVVAKMMKPQVAARTICRKLGFHEESVIPDYVKDQSGKSQDLVIMTCNIQELWKELDQFYMDSDWERCR
jgi:L-amino acid N-acyltransferase YncA